MRIACYSPLPPARSGIADYTAELLPELARYLDIELVVDEPARCELPPSLAGLAVHGPRELPALLGRPGEGRCEAVLYHLGNNRDYHSSIYNCLLEVPGVVVLHEAVLHHLVRDLTLHAGDPRAYLWELRYAYGRSGAALGRRCLETGVPLSPWSYPLFERVVDRSLGIIVHNEFTRARVLASRPAARVARIPHHLSLGGAPLPSREEARAALGLPAGDFIAASFGFVTAAKRPQVVVRACARLRREAPELRARLLLVGEISPHFDFSQVVGALPDGVEVTGRLDLARFLLYMAAADVAINLRYPTGGETSGTLIRLLGLGKPVIVSRAGAFAEIPAGCCAHVDVDGREEETLFTLLHRLATDEPLRHALGGNARRHIATHHTLAGSAAAYADFLRACAGAKPFRALPPLVPYPEDDLLSDLLLEVSAELSDLGVGEADEELLSAVAGALVELGLD